MYFLVVCLNSPSRVYSLNTPSIYLSIHISTYLPIYPMACPPTHLSAYLPIYPPTCPSIRLLAHLSTSLLLIQLTSLYPIPFSMDGFSWPQYFLSASGVMRVGTTSLLFSSLFGGTIFMAYISYWCTKYTGVMVWSGTGKSLSHYFIQLKRITRQLEIAKYT